MLVLFRSAQLTVKCVAHILGRCTDWRQTSTVCHWVSRIHLPCWHWPQTLLHRDLQVLAGNAVCGSHSYGTVLSTHSIRDVFQAKQEAFWPIYWSNLSYPKPYNGLGFCCLCLRRRMVISMVCASLSSGWDENLPYSLGLCCFPAAAGWEWCSLCQRSSSSTLVACLLLCVFLLSKNPMWPQAVWNM